MTRGKIIYIDKNKVMYCSCEFNGDMHPEHKGDQIIEIFRMVISRVLLTMRNM